MSQMLTGRDEVKALPLQTIFENATHGEDTAFTHSDQDTFDFAKRRARTAAQRLLDSAGQRFSRRVRVLTDSATLTITYCRAGGEHAAAPAARRRAERKAAAATGVVIETRKLEGGSQPLARGEYHLDDETLKDGEVIYGCQPGCRLSVGPAAAKEDDIRCSHCGRTNASALIEFGGITFEEGQEVLPSPTIQALYRIEGGRAVPIVRGTGRKTRKQVRDGDLGEAITEAAVKARKARAKKGRESLARRRGS